MRRVQSAIVILALLAIPAALVARTGPCARSQCKRMCALILDSVGEAGRPHCMCGMATNGAKCSTHSQQQLPDYGLNAPIAPTMLSAHVAIAAPDSTRRAVTRGVNFLAAEFASEFFEPPRT